MGKFISAFLIIGLLSLTILTPTAHAQSDWSGNCVYTHEGDDVATLQGIQCIVVNVLAVAIRLIGIVAFVMFVMGGIKMVSSGGSPEAMGAAQQTITLAIAGLALAVLSWFILEIVQQFTGVNVTIFEFRVI